VRALITGGNGFVGRHLVKHLRDRGDEVIVAGHGDDLHEIDFPLELCDRLSVRGVVEQTQPEVVFHLAAQSSVPSAISDPINTYSVNILGTAYLCEALRQTFERYRIPRLIFVSSGDVYGPRAAHEYPLDESLAPKPLNPYAASKAAGESVVLAEWKTYGIPAIVARAFNHLGPGQDERSATGTFAHQLARIAMRGESVLQVGDLKPERDFLDVRDGVAAYVALAERGTPGEIYNVCSGRPTKIEEVLRTLVNIAHVPVEIREDPKRMRPVDTPRSYGCNDKLRSATSWEPQHSLKDTLRDLYNDVVARERAKDRSESLTTGKIRPSFS
jgi:GDP-4-dehydro-6-deoxy-D-mannose reductase